jgi:hypothetical protein
MELFAASPLLVSKPCHTETPKPAAVASAEKQNIPISLEPPKKWADLAQIYWFVGVDDDILFVLGFVE